jgi:hypothetical protein
MSSPRSTEARIDWFLSHNPSGVGMCAQHSWHSLGGDYGNPPAWGASDANAVYDKVKKSGRYFTTTPPRGALVVWKYGNNGHAAISYGDGKIATTDPNGKPGKTGVESLTYPHKWGASASARIWTDEYNGVRFSVDDEEGDDDMPSAGEIAKAIWKDDIVPSPGGKDSDNPTWMAGSFLKEIYVQLQKVNANLEKLAEKLP